MSNIIGQIFTKLDMHLLSSILLALHTIKNQLLEPVKEFNGDERTYVQTDKTIYKLKGLSASNSLKIYVYFLFHFIAQHKIEL